MCHEKPMEYELPSGPPGLASSLVQLQGCCVRPWSILFLCYQLGGKPNSEHSAPSISKQRFIVRPYRTRRYDGRQLTYSAKMAALQQRKATHDVRPQGHKRTVEHTHFSRINQKSVFRVVAQSHNQFCQQANGLQVS